MKMIASNLRRGLVAVLAVAAAGMMLTACLKNNDTNTPPTPVAGLMAFNLAPDQPAVSVTLSGSNLTQTPLGYTSYTGAYQSIYTGSRAVESFASQGSGALASTNYNFEENKYYSLFVVGFNNTYRNVIAADKFDSLSTAQGNAYIRYINAIADTVGQPAVTITAGSNGVVSENASFASVSEFKAVSPGSVSIAVKNGMAVDAGRTISVEQNKVYTILLTGVPGATDDTKKVQIRFIENGTLSAANGG